jgi:uncharacterized membrane protein YgcG
MKTRQKIYQIISSILLAILISLSSIAPATAATYPYYFYWDFINVDIDVQTNGDMLITENQKYIFTKLGKNQRYRYIPLDKIDEISDVSVFEEDKKITFDTGIENNNFWIRWQHELNSPEEHTFTLKYRVIGGLNIYDEKYEVYWKAIFAKRNAPINKGKIIVTFPESFSRKIQEFRSYGVSTKAKQIDENTVEFISTGNIPPYQEIEVKVIAYDKKMREPIEVSAFTIFVITLLFSLIFLFPLLLILFLFSYSTGKNGGDGSGGSGGSAGGSDGGGGDGGGGGGGD